MLKNWMHCNANWVGANNHSPIRLPQRAPLPFNPRTQLIFHWQKTEFKSPSKTIGSIVRGFKIGVSKWVRQSDHNAGQRVWQRNYHDHIIRNYIAYERISRYIINNPLKWKEDKFYSQANCKR